MPSGAPKAVILSTLRNHSLSLHFTPKNLQKRQSKMRVLPLFTGIWRLWQICTKHIWRRRKPPLKRWFFVLSDTISMIKKQMWTNRKCYRTIPYLTWYIETKYGQNRHKTGPYFVVIIRIMSCSIANSKSETITKISKNSKLQAKNTARCRTPTKIKAKTMSKTLSYFM